MEGATHFIEQYRNKNGKNFWSSMPLYIQQLNDSLEFTKSIGATTIAIFKIKFKDERKANNTNTDAEN